MSSSDSPSTSPSRSSTTPPPKVPSKKTKKTTKPDLKGKKKATSPAEPRNEGVDRSNWDYTPPQGAVLIDCKEDDAGKFDWDAVNDDEDVELWLIRVPEAIKPKHLENLTIDMPSSSHASCVGTLKRKYMSFDLWDLGDDDSQNPVGGDEVKGISCLLPRKKKKGKLYPAPKPIARHMVLAAQPVKPAETNDSSSSFQNPQRPSYPKELFKHRFLPYGSLTKPVADGNLSIDVDMAPGVPTDDAVVQPIKPSSKSKQKAKAMQSESPEVQSQKTRKRKAYVEITDTPKKHKKTKAVS